jgi:NitT/TauT family transport system substrate-binding protein
MKISVFIPAVLVLSAIVGVSSGADAPSFSIAWSEYPSWSTFGVAGQTKVNGELLIDGAQGRQGSIEKKWNVDIVLKEADYDSCIVMYGAGQCDAACLTNMDALNPSLARASAAILPTSTSFGADACIVGADITDVKQLRGKAVRGLAKSVSEYCWARNLAVLGEKEKDHKFTNMDPGAAATAMQNPKGGIDAIMVWNPFVISTLNQRKDAHVLFDSTKTPGEIIDMVIMAQSSLDKPGGRQAACAIIEAYYAIAKRLAEKKTQDDTLVALGEKFAKVSAEDMNKCVHQTRFYATPEQGLALLTGGIVFPWKREVKDTATLFTNAGFDPTDKGVTDKTLKDIMPLVVDFCISREIVASKPELGYGAKADAPKAQLRFDPTYIKEVQAALAK